MKYPVQAQELLRLLQEDQDEWRNFAKLKFAPQSDTDIGNEQIKLKRKVQLRSERMLKILKEIQQPTLSNIGAKAAQAISILALHDSLPTLKKVLEVFNECYKMQKNNTYFQAIPSMTDWERILQRKPQKFGTIWLLDENNKPFLPTVENFDNVNERRAEYGIDPLHWPKLQAIPESQQPWLLSPLDELVMRPPTQSEYDDFAKGYLI
jgi:hypothetical protein